MSIRAVAERLCLSERQTRRVLADESVPVNAITVAGRQRVKRVDLERYLTELSDIPIKIEAAS